MYIDLVVLLVLILVVGIFFKRFSSFIFFIAIIDITLRILAFIKINCGLNDLAKVIGKYLPESIFDLIDKYTGDLELLNISLKWIFVGTMAIFLFYICKIFIKRKKI